MSQQTENKVPEIRFGRFSGKWEEKKLGELSPLRGGFAFESAKYCDAGIPIVKISNILPTGDVGGDFAFYEEQENDQNFTLPSQAAVLAMSGATTGKVSILNNPDLTKVYQNQRVGYFEDVGSVDYAFISTLVRSRFFTDQLDAVLVAGAQPNVSSKEIDNFDFTVPNDKAEQTQIGAYFKSLDRMNGLHQRKHDKLVTLKQAMLQKMFPQHGATTPEIRFKGFEGDWEEKKLGTVTSLLTGHPFEGKKFVADGILLVRGMNVKRGYLDTSNETSEYWPSVDGYETFLLTADDVVIQMDGALIGKSYAKIEEANLPALLVQRVTRVRCETVNSDFIYQYIQRDFLSYIRATKTETAVPHLSLNDIREFPIALPNESEQQKIGTYFRKLASLISKHETQLEKLKNIKSACLEKMFV